MGKKTAVEAKEAARPKKSGVRRGLVEHEIHEHATRLFAERGYAGTSFQDIADAVGLTRPALYHYVKSKDDLLESLVKEVTVVAATDIADFAGHTEMSPTERIRKIVRLMVRHQGEQGERFRLLLRSEVDLPESVAQSYADNRRAVLRSLTEVIEQGVTAGEFRPVTPTVAALGTLGIVNWVAWWYHPGSSFDLDAICTELAEQAVHSLAAEQGRPASTTPLDAVRDVRREIDRLEELLGQD
ncbi:TetR/AcrR family transcriptional regulator [Streptomyces chartreusis]|uniref:TetR/AcrR family transcriptional regulator n=1 Tax=Streptomyces chartreusis TaxID=1969 RepID=UPI002F91A7F8|nr:TetR/AcrR family transcriptional regulator [Streptomyces chartreusis]WTA33432.1 TetR/AcrR family transcriptional regulator [Streptomyces chartreusis]